jgi:hypothetical protein
MNRLVRRLAIAGGAVCLVVAGYAGIASAAPDTTVARCGTAWLRLWGSLGERCYTGNGVIGVNLTGVNREQIVGTHTVCLTTARVPTVRCVIGPRTVVILPPLSVTRVLISTP